ncbi:hypothetical protein I2F27_01455 [Acinetobacter sp. B5B]|uniref:hypothetical protein n=1 Tax=Acinetobacter baretiae TaxID=2605383 RepID=UPI0018C341A6|nr:hypothetical protein [Acinetobacter baretiae]MBF7682004.1 hypothetical protein [Acinetobacter baretiae]
MSKKLLYVAPIALILSACVTGTGSPSNADTSNSQGTTQQIGMTALKIAVNAKCTTELNNTAAWKIASQVMTVQQQQNAQNEVCGCVSDKVIQSVTVVDLANAAFDPTARTSIATKAINNTVHACVAEVLKS